MFRLPLKAVKVMHTVSLRTEATIPGGTMPPNLGQAFKVLLNRGSIIYPESKIPEWFHFQNRGSFIDVKLPPLWLNCNFLCIALCVVVAIPNPDRQCNHPNSEHHRYSEVACESYVKSKDGNQCVESNLCHLYPLLWTCSCGPDYMKSNHVIIGFGYYFFREFRDDEFSFQFKGCGCWVEMCGVHLISGLHLKTSDESEEEDESHLKESYEEDEPNPKRLKHIE
ncbi:hypothetical protein LWI29_028945 [Acer saccharum]|uniref:C-JID domain-containing protein n=1 Tax=Acer saccharum TaxID=4024 RepID=A0AA39SH01_ACESA|nr:hypothetical protein LWI29_028945 [Acer saccharum]